MRKRTGKKQAIYAYKFKGKRYDVGNKQGFLEATVEFALRRPDLSEDFLKYLSTIVQQVTIGAEIKY